jgi:hypothetical protein
MASYSGASIDSPRRSSEFGSRRAGHGDNSGEICVEDIPVVSSHCDCVIKVGANQAAGISIQFNHADGSPITLPQDFDLYVVSLTSGMISSLAATGGSTGIAIGAAGFIANTAVARKVFKCFTSAVGLFSASWTDNGSEVAYLAVRLPSGRLVVSAQLPTS